MKKPIFYIERKTGEKKEEKVFGEKYLRFLYLDNIFSRFLKNLIVKNPLFSKLYGWWNTLPLSKKRISPFVKTYDIPSTEFLDPIDNFSSFNDFFIRKLKPQTRPITPGEATLIIPADGRYLFYPTIQPFSVKGKAFSLETLLKDSVLAKEYQEGGMVIGRLCPTDCHRFYFPCSCIPSAPQLIKGNLYSVNPLALRENLSFLSENKRIITTLHTQHCGKILFIAVGATCVGSIHYSFTPQKSYKKGEECGFFSFGGSAIILLFAPGQIVFEKDLLHKDLEILCQIGQPLGKAVNYS